MTVTLSDEEYENLVNLAEVGKLVEVRGENDSPALQDIWLAGQPVGKIIESNRKKADSATKKVREDPSSGDEPHPQGGEDGSADDLLPIERLSRLKDDGEAEENPFADTTPSVDRAVVLHENFRSWSQKAPKGRVIKSGLKKLLNTALDAKLSWKQVYRSCRKLEEWSKGSITFKKTSRHGWILVMDEQSSSAGGG